MMSDLSSRDSSPDPITLASSPLSSRKLLRGSSRKPRLSTPRFTSRASPSKSIVLDTPQGGDGQNPWRIKVTVQAEPRDGSPGKTISRTRSISLVSPSTRKSSSPGKKGKGKMADGEGKRPSRKRKGTPIRAKRSAPQLRRPQSQQESDPEPELDAQSSVEEHDEKEEIEMPVESQTPPNNRRASGRMARLTAQWSDGSGRTKRLSAAREELDQALMDAVGGGDVEPGEMTLSRAEDFTMVSMESLQTAKEASMLPDSHLNAMPGGHKSALSVSYLPSSPPKTQGQPNATHPNITGSVSRSSFAPNEAFEQTAKANVIQTSLQSPFKLVSSAKKRSSLRRDYDVMSWQPTGPAKRLQSSHREAETQPARVHIPRSEWQQERAANSQHAHSANLRDALVVDDDDHPESSSAVEFENEDESDLWNNEASRSLGEEQNTRPRDRQQTSPESPSSSAGVTRSSDRPPQGDADGQHEPPSTQNDVRPERFEDLFSHMPLKPARPKIPRTWRRSSGIDFPYVDSPARDPVLGSREEHRPSENGSGVLTPPSSQEENAVADDQDEVGTVDLQGEADDQLQSEFTIPEAEATRYQDEDMQLDTEVEVEPTEGHDGDGLPRVDSKSPVYDNDRAEIETGESLRDNPSRFSYKERPRRRPPRRPTTDLADLLNLNGSPANPAPKPSPRGQAMHGTGNSKLSVFRISESASTNGLKSKRNSGISSGAPTENLGDRTTARSNDLFRQRMLKSKTAAAASNGISNSAIEYAQWQAPPSAPTHVAPQNSSSLLTHDPLTGEALAQPKRRGRQRRAQQLGDNSQTESTVTDSFTSTSNDQRQLLRENATSRLARNRSDRPITGIGYCDCAVPHGEHQAQKPRLNHQTPGQRQQQAEVSDIFSRRDLMVQEELTEGTIETSRQVSYQENLNLDSPTKVKVNFNDTVSGNSSWLDQPKQYPPLFSQNSQQPRTPLSQSFRSVALHRPQRPEIEAPVDTTKKALNAPSILSRLSTTFWNAVIRPTGPAEVMPPLEIRVTFPAALHSQIRSRYGVLCESFPWTMAHMRTLHRMLNSLTSGRYDSVIPRKGALPKELDRKTNTIQRSVTNHQFLFRLEHAYVVWSFMQILVSPDTIQMMARGDIEFIGDGTAKRIRGYFDPKRHGDDPVWTRESLKHKDPAIADWVQAQTGLVGVDFVSKALGDCILANEVLKERLQREGRSHEFERVCFGDIRATPERNDESVE